MRLALAVGLASMFTAPLLAQQGRQATSSVRLSAEQMLAISSDLTRQGRVVEAKKILDLLSRDPRPDVRSEARFRQAGLLEAEGNYQDAALLLRRILDEKPESPAVRLQLATLLQKMGDEDAALHELRAVRASDLPLNVARFVDRLSASLQSTKPVGFQFEVAVAPDTNINRATRSDTLGTVLGDFTFDEDAQAKSGIGAALRGLAHARLSLTDELSVDTRLSGDANLYRHKDFNDITVDLATGPEWRLRSTRIALEAGIGQQWFGMSPYQRNSRVAASIVRPLNAVSQLRVDVGRRWANNAVNDLQDGQGWSVRGRYERAFSPRLSIVASVGTDRFHAEDDAYSTRSWGGSLTAYREMGRMTLSAGAEIGRLKADERLQILPHVREDRLIRLQLGSVFRQLTIGGFAPITRLVIERNRSTVEFYDYKRIRTEVGLSRAF
jgi:tetratricopeptide (TPR) repeat protein